MGRYYASRTGARLHSSLDRPLRNRGHFRPLAARRLRPAGAGRDPADLRRRPRPPGGAASSPPPAGRRPPPGGSRTNPAGPRPAPPPPGGTAIFSPPPPRRRLAQVAPP